MMQRGQKSAAKLSVLRNDRVDTRPQPPPDLPPWQRDLWLRVVRTEHPSAFATASSQEQLKLYLRHAEAAHLLAKQIEIVQRGDLSDGSVLSDYDRLLRMRDRETKGLSNLARALRLCNQSRYSEVTAANKAKQVAADVEKRPWERGQR
jgi:hypothetical protein